MRQPWFWGTLGFWVLLGGGISWALIESTLGPDFQYLGRFEGEINGLQQKHQLEVCQGFLADGLKKTTFCWEKDGWRSLTGPLDLLSIVTGLPSGPSPLSAQIQAGLYQKGKNVRAFALWNDEVCIYRWTMEFQENRGRMLSLITQKGFPLRPPDDAINFFQGSAGNFKMATWQIPLHQNPISRFKLYCTDQGFSTKSLQGGPQTILLLRKGNLRLAAIIHQGNGMNRITLGLLPSSDLI